MTRDDSWPLWVVGSSMDDGMGMKDVVGRYAGVGGKEPVADG